MRRLNFLSDVYDFVKKWSFRPRWPGDRRHVPEDQRFDRMDAEHLEHLRDDRIKRLSHAIAAQALGFEPDIRRGLWKFVDSQTGEELWHHPESKRFFVERENGSLVETARPQDVSEEDAGRPRSAHTPVQVIVFENLIRYDFRSDRSKAENAGLMKWGSVEREGI